MSVLSLQQADRRPYARSKRVSMRTLAIIVGWVVSVITALIGGAWSAGAFQTSLNMRMDSNVAGVKDHENRIRIVEAELSGLSADVRWIRANLEQRSRMGGS